jgi:hypothetical protein
MPKQLTQLNEAKSQTLTNEGLIGDKLVATLLSFVKGPMKLMLDAGIKVLRDSGTVIQSLT